MLQHHAELDPRAPAGGDHLLGTRRGDLQRLLQQHVFARRCAALHQVQMRVRRRKHRYRIDRRVLEDGLQPVALRKRKLSGELRAPRRARAEGVGDLDTVGSGPARFLHAAPPPCRARPGRFEFSSEDDSLAAVHRLGSRPTPRPWRAEQVPSALADGCDPERDAARRISTC